MNIVLDNIIFALQRAGGVSVYWYELLRRMKRDSRSIQVIEHPHSASNIFRKRLSLDPVSVIDERSLPLSIVRYLPFKGIKDGQTIHHSSYYRIPEKRGSISVTTVHDFTYERFRRGPARIIHTLQKRAALKAASGIICVSENTKRDLLEFYPEIAAKNICVIYHGVSEHYRTLGTGTKRLLPSDFPEGPFVLFVGGRGSYKNFHLALESVKTLPNYRFVSVGGGRLKPSEAELSQKLLPGRHIHLPVADNELLNVLYNCAHALLYPSSYEGFGIPIIEAMAAGCPVIAANFSSIPEVCGEAGLLVEEILVETLSEQILRLENSVLRSETIRKGYIQASRFSWEACYLETLNFYEKIMQEKRKE